jgi:hypothetical protein
MSDDSRKESKMGTKMYKKSKLEYKNGYIVKNGKIISVDNKIVDMFNQLETDYQRALWDANHPVMPAVGRPEFQFETERGKVHPVIKVHTPNLDEAISKAKDIMDDLDAIDAADRATEYLNKIQPLIQFICDDHIVSCNQETLHRFDLKFIGNPLELDKETLGYLVHEMFS